MPDWLATDAGLLVVIGAAILILVVLILWERRALREWDRR